MKGETGEKAVDKKGATPRCFCVSKIHGFLGYNLRWGDEIMKNCGISSTPPCVGS